MRNYNNMDSDLSMLSDLDIVKNKVRVFTDYKKSNPIEDYPDEHFKARYRMSKDVFRELCAIVEPGIAAKNNIGVPIEEMLLVALRFYATGSMQAVNGDAIGIAQCTVSRIISKVSREIAALYPRFIKWPDQHQAPSIASGFERMVNTRYPSAIPFPRVIGAVDGTHVQLLAAGVENRENFRNRKGFISLNVQAICDNNLLFTNVVARWPGSVHDSRVFKMSEVCSRLEAGELRGYWLVGDSGYACAPFLMTPIANPSSRAEERYNFSHIQTRNVIERAFGVLKRRFSCLHGEMRLSLQNSMSTIIACFVLHNFLRIKNDFWEDDALEIPNGIDNSNRMDIPNVMSSKGQRGFLLRAALIADKFTVNRLEVENFI